MGDTRQKDKLTHVSQQRPVHIFHPVSTHYFSNHRSPRDIFVLLVANGNIGNATEYVFLAPIFYLPL